MRLKFLKPKSFKVPIPGGKGGGGSDEIEIQCPSSIEELRMGGKGGGGSDEIEINREANKHIDKNSGKGGGGSDEIEIILSERHKRVVRVARGAAAQMRLK